jgi:hypothetical protein
MNPLVEYLTKHHNPGGNAIEHVFIEEIIDDTGWSKQQIFNWLMEGNKADLLTFTPTPESTIGEYTPDDIMLIGIWNELYRKWPYRRK